MAGSALREVFARFGVDWDNGPLLRGSESVNGVIDDLGRMAQIVGGGALIMGLRSFAGEMTQIGDSLNDTSIMLGVSTQDLQQWQHVAVMNGASADEFTMSMVRLQNRMAQGGQGAQVFHRLGVSIHDANGQLRNASDVLTELADPISHLSSDAARTGVLMDLLGRSGARMAPLFLQGSAGIRAARQELERLGGGATPQMIEEAAALDDANHRLDASWLSLRSRLAIFVLPMFERFTAGITNVNAALTRMADRGRLVQAVLAVLGTVAALQAARTLAAWVPVVAPFLAVGVAVLALILLVEDLMVAFDGGLSVFQGFSDAIDEWAQEWSDPENGPISGVVQAFQFLEGIIASTYQRVAELTGLLPEIGDDVENLAGETSPEAALAHQIATERRAAWTAQGASTESLIPDTVEREQALRDARAQLATGRVPHDLIESRRRGDTTAPTVSQSVHIERIDTSGLTEAQAGRMVESAITRALTAQADDTLDVVAGG